jgi:hypothetical protein
LAIPIGDAVSDVGAMAGSADFLNQQSKKGADSCNKAAEQLDMDGGSDTEGGGGRLSDAGSLDVVQDLFWDDGGDCQLFTDEYVFLPLKANC